MKSKILITGTLLALMILLTACSKERKKYMNWSKKGTIAQKDSAAMYFYNRGDYERAAFLFEELNSAYRGDDRGKDILFYYAYSKYETKLYIIAAYYFEQYSKLYPNDDRTEECAYMVGLCNYQEASPYYLDQTYTLEALDRFQFFIDSYPYSRYGEEVLTYMADLRERLAHKAFETAYQYYKIFNYKAAVTSFGVMMGEFPDSDYREEAQFMQFKSAALLADVSSERRKRNRYLDAIDFYEEFVDKYPNSQFLKEAEGIYVRAKRSLGKVLARSGDES